MEEETDGSVLNLELLKIQICMNVAKIDFDMHEKEIEFISDLIENSDLEDDEKGTLLEELHSKELIQIDLSAIKGNDLYSLAIIEILSEIIKIDGIIKSVEKIYFYKIAKELGFTKEDVTEMLEMEVIEETI